MKEGLKKGIAAGIMTISVIGIVLSVYFGCRTNGQNDVLPQMEQSRQMDGGVPPEMNRDGRTTPPEMNNGTRQRQMIQNGQTAPTDVDRPEMGTPPEMQNDTMMNGASQTLSVPYIVLICVFSVLFALSLMYLLMSIKNSKFYKNTDKAIIYALSSILVTAVVACAVVLIGNQIPANNKPTMVQTTEKDDVVLDEGNVLQETSIDLSKQTTDVTITSAGSYTLSGDFANSVIVDAPNEEVELILDNATIENDKTAAIIGLAAKKITITTKDGTTNTLSDGGNSEYDGCIYSATELVFDGEGKLVVNGKQNDGEGIATETANLTFNGGTYVMTSTDDGLNAGGDGGTITINDGTFYINASGDGIDSNQDAVINGGTIFVVGSDTGGNAGIDTEKGYAINGGTVVALGTDMLETPLSSSKQKFVTFTLNESIAKESPVALMSGDETVISFESPKSFRTIVVSTDDLKDGEYALYTGGSDSGKLSNGIYQGGSYTGGKQISTSKAK